jgi:hypothetical protein
MLVGRMYLPVIVIVSELRTRDEQRVQLTIACVCWALTGRLVVSVVLPAACIRLLLSRLIRIRLAV